MISILNSAVAAASSRKISLVHGARSSEVRAFADTLRRAAEKPNVQATVFLSTLKDGEVRGVDYDFEGRVNLETSARSACSRRPDYELLRLWTVAIHDRRSAVSRWSRRGPG